MRYHIQLLNHKVVKRHKSTRVEASLFMRLLAETEGIFAETAGGVVIVGLRKLVTSGIITRDELTVAFITGAGLKTQEVIAEWVHPLVIQPTLESFEEVFGE